MTFVSLNCRLEINKEEEEEVVRRLSCSRLPISGATCYSQTQIAIPKTQPAILETQLAVLCGRTQGDTQRLLSRNCPLFGSAQPGPTPDGRMQWERQRLSCSRHQPSERDQPIDFQVLDLCWRSPQSGDLWYRLRRLKKTFCPPSEGWWTPNIRMQVERQRCEAGPPNHHDDKVDSDQ